MKVLLVDESAFTRNIVKGIIVKSGISEVIEADNGIDAVDMYLCEKPDLVFMDTTLPGIDGIEALRRIKMYESAANIVLCATVGQDNVVKEAIGLGVTGFIVKPLKAEKILDYINKRAIIA